jgi:hypothetical protein
MQTVIPPTATGIFNFGINLEHASISTVKINELAWSCYRSHLFTRRSLVSRHRRTPVNASIQRQTPHRSACLQQPTPIAPATSGVRDTGMIDAVLFRCRAFAAVRAVVQVRSLAGKAGHEYDQRRFHRHVLIIFSTEVASTKTHKDYRRQLLSRSIHGHKTPT